MSENERDESLQPETAEKESAPQIEFVTASADTAQLSTVEEPEVPADTAADEPEMNGTKPVDWKRELIGAGIGVGTAVLFLTIGFWKTLLIAALGCAGAFVLGVPDKQQRLKDLLNRLFPPRE